MFNTKHMPSKLESYKEMLSALPAYLIIILGWAIVVTMPVTVLYIAYESFGFGGILYTVCLIGTILMMTSSHR